MGDVLAQRTAYIDEHTLSLGGKIGAAFQGGWNAIADNSFTQGVGRGLTSMSRGIGDAVTATGA